MLAEFVAQVISIIFILIYVLALNFSQLPHFNVLKSLTSYEKFMFMAS